MVLSISSVDVIVYGRTVGLSAEVEGASDTDVMVEVNVMFVIEDALLV